MNTKTRRHFLATTLALLTLLGTGSVAASEKPISIVVPYAAGGTNDAYMRLIAEGMSRELGRTVLVENKPGANGIIGSTYVAKAAPDGTTLLMGGTGPVSLNSMLRPKLAYNTDSFDSVAMLFDGPLTITVPTKLGVNSVEELVNHAKKISTPVRYGTLGPGSVTHLYGLLLGKNLGIKTVPVAYKNNPSSLVDLIAGQAELSFATPSALVEYQKAGDLKILALTTKERDPSFPDIPTVTELGYPQLISSYWAGLHAPKGTPPDVLKKLSDAAVKAAQAPEFVELLRKNGLTAKGGGKEALDAQLETDRQNWGTIIKENNIVLN
ncbi:MAG: tripartite tricarboxylate transporter substrate binding protein [Alcaligenaceae bacterium]|nr:tripartite tricarboxylate transporter substrate binding protein [Alcaligenaceae bacterium]